jgi:pyruvate dehydrogenase E1 component
VNRRKLFSRQNQEDVFKRERVPVHPEVGVHAEGQHLELGIAEMNLFLLLGAAGLSHSLFAKRLIPIGTVYDPFVVRGLDALNYACYQDARFHHRWHTVRRHAGTGRRRAPVDRHTADRHEPGRIAAFEPAFADELAVIMEWAFDYMQRSGDGDPDERTWLRDETGGSVYLRLTTNGPLSNLQAQPMMGFGKVPSTAPTGEAQAGAELPMWSSLIRAASHRRPSPQRASSPKAGATSACSP